MKLAYADPPYIGMAHHYTENEEVDHAALITRLMAEFDGWALSCHSPSLRQLLPLCPEGTRVMAWVKPFCSFKPHVNPAYAWEPLLVFGGRRRGREKPTVRDWVSLPMATRRGLFGAKPESLAWWVFEVLGAEPGDEFVDLYPGTGIFGRAWRRFQEQLTIPFG